MASAFGCFVNRGGLGWLRNVFAVQIKLDDGSRLVDADPLFAMPWSAYEPRVSLYPADGTISGTIIVTAPEGKGVQHEGITIAFVQYAATADPYDSTDQWSMERVVAEPAAVTGTQTVRFSLDLRHVVAAGSNSGGGGGGRSGEGGAEVHLDDTFTGKLFGVQHKLTVTIHRPWFTFPVVKHKMVAIQRLDEVVVEEISDPAATPVAETAHLTAAVGDGRCIVVRLSSLTLTAGGTVEADVEATAPVVIDGGGGGTSGSGGGGRGTSGSGGGGGSSSSVLALLAGLSCAKLVIFSVEQAEGASLQEVLSDADVLTALEAAGPTDKAAAAAAAAATAAASATTAPAPPMTPRRRAHVAARLPRRPLPPTFATTVDNDAAEADCALRYYAQLVVECGSAAQGRVVTSDAVELLVRRNALDYGDDPI